MKNEFRRNTILFGLFCILYGLASILIGVYVFYETADQPVYIVSGVGLIAFAIWFLFDQLS